MTDKRPSKEKARNVVNRLASEAKSKLADLGTVHRFATKDTVSDKAGNEAKALIIDTERPGVLGMFMNEGLPVTLSPGGDMVADDPKLAVYFGFMSNIDITKEENLSAIGWSALAKGRELVSVYFHLRLVASMKA